MNTINRDELLDTLCAAYNVISLLLPLVPPSDDRWAEYGLTDKGRAEIEAHLAEIKAAIDKARNPNAGITPAYPKGRW